MDDLKNAAALAFMLGIAGVVVYPFAAMISSTENMVANSMRQEHEERVKKLREEHEMKRKEELREMVREIVKEDAQSKL
jgi:hypothetical protein